MGDALAGWFVAYFAAATLGALILAAAGYAGTPDDVPLWLLALTYPPLWLGFVGVPVFVAHRKGNGWIRDFRAHLRWIDVPIGLGAGIAAQLILVPLVSWPVLRLTGQTAEDLARPAEELADKAVGTGGALLFFLIVGIGAPLAEELFYRGLVLRSIDQRWGRVAAVLLSSLWFGVTHFQPLQLAALTAAGLVFALLAVRFDRLGPAVMAHVAFNTTTVVALLWLT
jgi:membrane protease YdiL (CAAX protease family)